MPADGVKGKTWGPSTCHQRERGTLPSLGTPMAHCPAGRGAAWSKSAPNLDKSLSGLQYRSGSSSGSGYTQLSASLLHQSPTHVLTPGGTLAAAGSVTSHDLGNKNNNKLLTQYYIQNVQKTCSSVDIKNFCKQFDSTTQQTKQHSTNDCLSFPRKIPFFSSSSNNTSSDDVGIDDSRGSRKFSLLDFFTIKTVKTKERKGGNNYNNTHVRLSRSIGDITDTKNYDVLVSQAKKFVIAKGKNSNYGNYDHISSRQYDDDVDGSSSQGLQDSTDSLQDDTRKLL